MSNLLITGGAGFIGSHFIKHILKKGAYKHVINLDALKLDFQHKSLKGIEKKYPNYLFIRDDICQKSTVEWLVQKCDTVVHFAAESHVDRSITGAMPFIETNVLGTCILLEAALKYNIKRFLFVSTDEAYGSVETGESKETDILDPSSVYSATKVAGEYLAKAYYKTHKLPVVITRSTNNFGPFQHPEKFIPKAITNFLQGKKVPVYGKGENIREWLYVRDNCEAIEFVLQNGKIGEAYNIGSGTRKKNIEIVNLILKYLRKDESFIEHVEDRKGHDLRYAVDCTKLYELGWTPKHFSFEENLIHTILWYRNNKWWWEPLVK